MAIDSTLFGAVIPAGTYTIGDRLQLAVIRGPSVVRDGYGPAYLKRFVALTDSSSAAISIHIKNANWDDEMSNVAMLATNDTALGKESCAVQSGQNCKLTPNSTWIVYGEFANAVTTTVAADVFALIDVDYPAVAAIENPANVDGFPVTIEYNNNFAHTISAIGTCNVATWDTVNVDLFKAGSKYLLTEAAFRDGSSCGFMSISGAAGQNGLERIIPVKPGFTGLRYLLDYSTPLVKGPMNLNVISFGTAGPSNAYLYMDYVKKPL